MPLLKRTYTLPEDTLDRFEESVAPGKRSAVVAELLREWIEEQERQELRRRVIEGCRDMADVFMEVQRDFEPLDEEIARAIEP